MKDEEAYPTKSDRERITALETKMGFIQTVSVIAFTAGMTAIVLLISTWLASGGHP